MASILITRVQGAYTVKHVALKVNIVQLNNAVFLFCEGMHLREYKLICVQPLL